MLPSLVLYVVTRVLRVAIVLVAAWTLATAALESIDEAARQAQAEINAGPPSVGATAYDPKEISVDRSVPWS